jgi:hypothetical protein
LLDLIVPCHEEWICWSVSILSAHSSWIGVFDEIAAKNGRHLDEISCSVCVCVWENFPRLTSHSVEKHLLISRNIQHTT